MANSKVRIELYQRLSDDAFKAVESAYANARRRGHRYVELAHWLQQMQLDVPASDLAEAFAHFGIVPTRLAKDLEAYLEGFPSGGTDRPPAFSADLDKLVQEAWNLTQIVFRETRIRSGHALLAALGDEGLHRVLTDISPEFEKLKSAALTDDFERITMGSVESRGSGSDRAPMPEGSDSGEALSDSDSALDQFSVDYTAKARNGEIDPIVGRDAEIRQIADILMRRRQNNPILLGEAGVGKTAVVEGFALRIARGDVPPGLAEIRLCELDLGLLQAGASVKGEFEERLRRVIQEVEESAEPIVLFIDEAHNLIGAGGSAGQGDAANLLKPALARGTLRTIAATTFDEYKKYFEDDPALQRRFQDVTIDEPSVEHTVLMLRGTRPTLERHHGVEILEEALVAAANLSHRYIPARRLPDKAVSLLDTACARVGISQHAVPGEIDDTRKQIEALEAEAHGLDREIEVGLEHADRRAQIDESLETERQRLADLEVRWEAEKQLAGEVLDLRGRLRGTRPAGGEAADSAAAHAADPADSSVPSELSEGERAEVRDQLKTRLAELEARQGDSPLILPTVDAQAIAAVVGDWTGVPVGRMVKDEIEAVLRLADTLEERVLGQRHALDAIAKRIETAHAHLDNPGRPIGVFLLVGPSGVGKTETAMSLAEALYGGEANAITLNMSEFQEQYTVSLLKGSPPGYQGHKEGGLLTNAVRRKPYSVVLLDEVEKAHTDVHEVFFQVFDKGVLVDSKGQTADFKNTIILLTSNAGSDVIMDLYKDPEREPDLAQVEKALRGPLRDVFPAALLGRLIVVPYKPIHDDILGTIIELQIRRIQDRMRENHGAELRYDDDVVELIKSRCHELESGARMVDAILTQTILPEISRELLERMVEGKAIGDVRVSVRDDDFAYHFAEESESGSAESEGG